VKPWTWAVIAGVAVGLAYTLSPLTVIAIGLLFPLWKAGSADLNERERRWFTAIFCVAVVTRLAIIGGLFVSADSTIPYANFFGDEEFFKRRTTWLLNLGMGTPISPADYFYAFDHTGETSYLFVLTYVQALVGLAPYGVHVLNALLYVAASVFLFRLVRPSFQTAERLGGLLILLFLPSLFIWSISALKEPLYFFVVSLNLMAAAAVLRSDRWWQRALGVLAVAVGGYVLQSIREGGLAIAGAGLVGGAMLSLLVRRPRLLTAAVIGVPLVAAMALTRPGVQARAWAVVHEAAYKHWGHVHTQGWTYKILDDRFYPDRNLIPTMKPAEAGRFIVRAVYSYVTVPLPWQIESRRSLAFLPEQVVWYVLIALVPFGVIGGIRRDPALVSLLIAHGAAVSLLVAMSGGNVGTLIRHRGLAMPYFAWLAALGAVTIGSWILARAPGTPALAVPPSPKAGLA